MQGLGDKLALLTLQFAYDFEPGRLELLDGFLAGLPTGPRYAVEIRNRRWLNDRLARDAFGKRRGAGAAGPAHMPKLDWLTADFTVVRWLGRRSDIEKFDALQIDRRSDLEGWAAHVRGFLEAGIDVFGYFNNHYAGHSPASAEQFAAILGQGRR